MSLTTNVEAYVDRNPFKDLEHYADPAYFKKWQRKINGVLLHYMDFPDCSIDERRELLVAAFHDIGQDSDFIYTEERDILLTIMAEIAVVAELTEGSGDDWVDANCSWIA